MPEKLKMGLSDVWMFPYTISVHVMTSRAQYLKYRLQHMYSIYFSVHYDRERDERTFAVFAGASVRPEKS